MNTRNYKVGDELRVLRIRKGSSQEMIGKITQLSDTAITASIGGMTLSFRRSDGKESNHNGSSPVEYRITGKTYNPDDEHQALKRF